MASVSKFSLRDFWAICRPYWVSEERWAARGLLGVIVGLNLGMVYLNVVFNEWYGVFYNSLQEKDADVFWQQMIRFSWLAAIFILVGVYRVYLNQMLNIRWRRWMTERFTADWLARRTHYRLQVSSLATDNPDQRISEDTKAFVTYTLQLGLGLMNAVVTLFSFLAILWTLSGPLEFTALGMDIVIPGYMVWAAFGYAVIGTWIINKVGRPLVGLNFDQQHFEADFRFGLVRLRENSEAVALYGGEAREHEGLTRTFTRVVGNWWQLMKRTRTLTYWSLGYSQAAIIFPFLAGAPRYFSGAIQLGGLMQINSAFSQVQEALSFVVTAYANIADWRAVMDRLITFRHAIDATAVQERAGAIALAPGKSDDLDVELEGLSLPTGSRLIDRVKLHLRKGQATLIGGASGTGKSTLFRAFSGLWPFGQGRVTLPAHGRVMFMPQKPYMPLGTLAEALSYPESASETTDEAKRQALEDCNLAPFAARLQDERNWGQVLSPGEQQRVAFARILLKKPDWVFLDEATASLDDDTQLALYKKLRERLPAITIVSIGHRAGLADQHERKLVLRFGPAGAQLTEAAPAPA